MLSVGLVRANGNYTFRLIDTSNGLPDNEVRGLFTLPDGRWGVRTSAGISLFDGCEFRTFAPVSSDGYKMNYATSLPYAYVDARHCVWVKEPGRLLAFDLVTERYRRDFRQLFLAMGVKGQLRDFFVDDAQDYWVVTSSGQLLLSHRGKSEAFSVPVKGLKDICRVGDIAWLVYTDGLMVRLDVKTGKMLGSQRLWQGDVPQRDFVRFAKAGNHLWVMWKHGVAYCAATGKQWRQVYADGQNTLVTICADARGKAYVGIRHVGLLTLDVSAKSQLQGVFPIVGGGDFVDDIQTVACVNDNLVLGFFARGLCLYNAKMKPFPFVAFDNRLSSVLGNYRLADYGDGLSMLTYPNGLMLLQPGTDTPVAFDARLSDQDIIHGFRDSKNRVWVGTFRRGMYMLDGQHAITHYTQGENAANDINYDIVRGFAEDYRQRIWVSFHGGIGWVDEARHRIVPVRHKLLEGVKNINAIAFDKHHNLWMATNDGLFCYSLDTREVLASRQLVASQEMADKLMGICRLVTIDSHGRKWIGTLNGLYVIDTDRNVRFYGKRQGLPNEMIQGIIEDRMGNVWVTTANGLCRFANKGREGVLTVFDGQNRLGDAKFLPMALAHGVGDKLLFGCSDGYYVVAPSEDNLPSYSGHPIFTSMMVNNQLIQPGVEYDGKVILPTALSMTRKVTLRHDENFLTLRFSGLNFDMPLHTSYKYRMQGVDDKWVEVNPQDGVGMVSYANLQPGTYTFEVYSSGFDKAWSKQPALLEIEVQAPLWATWWAKLLYLLLVVGMVTYGIRWKMEQNRRRLENEKYKELEEMKYRFFTNISHEFRTLLTLIITPIGSLLKRTKDEDARAQLNDVSRNAGDLLQLVNQLLDFRKMEMNGERLNLTSGNLDEFIQYTTLKFTPLSEQKNIQLSFEDRSNGLFMYFDRDKVGKILTNLLSNAFKFTKSGGRVGVILEKHMIDSRRYAHIIVEDTGCGISQEEQAHVFERFYRTEQGQSSQQVGSGIGLNMVYEHIKLHQGKISLESEVGKGSRFIVDIPADLKHVLQQEASGGNDQSSPEATDSAVAGESTEKIAKTVMVVEDNDDFRHFLSRELCHIYNKVLTAKDGLEGALMAETENPDIIVSDVMMPRMNGTDLCRRIKENLQTSHIPVILLTAWSTDEGRAEGYKAGADAYIAKPFDMEVLLARISNLLEKQEARQRDFSHSISLDPKAVADSTPDEKFLQEIIGFIERNIDNSEYTIDSLAADMVMSRMSLYRKMKSLTGQTPADFIRTVRLKTAAKLLKTEKCNVSEACFRTGFASPQNFTKHFKEMFGVLPSQYS